MIGAILALSGRKARKAPKTQGAPPAPLMHDIALKSRARLMGRSAMVMVLMVVVSRSWAAVAGGGRRDPHPASQHCQRPNRAASSRLLLDAWLLLSASWLNVLSDWMITG